MQVQVLALGLLLLTAGCLGGDEGGDDTGGSVEPTDTDGDGEPDVPNAPEEPTITWTSETRDGSVTSVNVVAVSTSTQESDTVQEIVVPEGAAMMVLNVTVDGGNLQMLVSDPSCDYADPFNTCEEVVSVSGGAGTYSAEAPVSGAWHARFFASDPGLTQATYSLTIAVGVSSAPPAEE